MRPKWILLVAVALTLLVSCQALPSGDSTTQAPAIQAPETQAPVPDEANLTRAGVSVTSQELLVKESYPLQVSLHITGTLPTPCHQLKVEVGEPDEQNQIAVEVYSLVNPKQNCIQVLKAFDETVPLGSYPDGTYTVTINGEEAGQFTQ